MLVKGMSPFELPLFEGRLVLSLTSGEQRVNRLSFIHSIVQSMFHTEYSMKKVIQQLEKERLLFSASFTAKCELVFVLTQENVFSEVSF